jgi:hypothetical protein
MRKRKLLAVVLAAGTTVLPAAIPAAHADDDPAAATGRFTTPFREDAAPYDAGANSFGGDRGDDGCLDPDDKGHRDCLPAGASENVLADGRVLYWNAIEGAEDLDQPTEAVVPSGGDLARNDRSRVLSIDWAHVTGANWYTPANATGYHKVDGEPPLIPIPGATNDNPDTTFNSDGSLFCSDQKQLANGTILAAGGTNYYAEPRLNETTGVIELEGVRNARIFDPGADGGGAWNPTGSLHYGRWYPSMVTLANGDLFIASGVTKLIKPLYRNKDPQYSGDNVPQTETYSPATGEWTENGTTGERSLPLFPRLHLLPNGHVYYDAAGQAFNPMGQSYKQALWNVAATYDPASKAWTNLGVPGLDNPVTTDGDYAEPGFRGSTFSQALPYKADGNGDYNNATFLTAGGVQLMSPGSYLPTKSTRLTSVDTSGGDETLSTTPAGPLGRPRWYSSAVTLPTGQVFAFSGADVDEVVSPGHESPIRQAEMFTPTYDAATGKYTGGSWQDVAVAQRRRTYHNNAVLLPDGRILVGGHAPIPNTYFNTMNDPEVPGSPRPASNNYKDASFEIYEPPYLHWGVDRPVIDNMNPAVHYGEHMVVPTHDADDVTSVVLVRNPAETHLIDADQRVVELPIENISGDSVQVRVTDNAAALPPGPYMLFINKGTDKGLVPSVARQVFVGTDVPGWARGADTYPTAETDAVATPPAPAGVIDGPPAANPAADATAAVTKAVESAQGTELPSAPASSDRPRPSGLLALALGGVVLALGSLAGTRRRRKPVRITE